MRRRSDRLREKDEGLQADEEMVNRRQSAGSFLGLNAPAESKNLEDAQALDAAAAALPISLWGSNCVCAFILFVTIVSLLT